MMNQPIHCACGLEGSVFLNFAVVQHPVPCVSGVYMKYAFTLTFRVWNIIKDRGGEINDKTTVCPFRPQTLET